jgi:type III pantothenate kinase
MLLVADAGNSQVTVGIYDNDNLIHRWGLSSARLFSADEYGVMIVTLLEKAGVYDQIDGGIISSVVSHLTMKLKNALEKYLKITPVIVTHQSQMSGVSLNVERNEEVGADRICNVVGAFILYEAPLVVVDMGTATTFDVLNERGEFIGGAICAGIGMCTNALASKTSLLPSVEVNYIDKAIARNTETNILSGSIIGHAAMVDGMLDRIETEIGQRIKSIGTGGYSIYIEQHLKRKFDHYNPQLTMDGLRLLYELNK